LHAPQADHAEEVLDVVHPARHQPAEGDGAKQKVARLANVDGSDAEGDHLASIFAALHDAVRSFRCQNVRSDLDPSGHCHMLCRQSADIAALPNYLEIPRADLVGHLFGGASAIRAGIRHPDNVAGW
jgi:hypothetical protein